MPTQGAGRWNSLIINFQLTATRRKIQLQSNLQEQTQSRHLSTEDTIWLATPNQISLVCRLVNQFSPSLSHLCDEHKKLISKVSALEQVTVILSSAIQPQRKKISWNQGPVKQRIKYNLLCYYMKTIIQAVWLAAELAGFPCNHLAILINTSSKTHVETFSLNNSSI